MNKRARSNIQYKDKKKLHNKLVDELISLRACPKQCGCDDIEITKPNSGNDARIWASGKLLPGPL
jgi:hypothetical protein